jgi:hypothetical protein
MPEREKNTAAEEAVREITETDPVDGAELEELFLSIATLAF